MYRTEADKEEELPAGPFNPKRVQGIVHRERPERKSRGV
jgi:hypothetical protein